MSLLDLASRIKEFFSQAKSRGTVPLSGTNLGPQFQSSPLGQVARPILQPIFNTITEAPKALGRTFSALNPIMPTQARNELVRGGYAVPQNQIGINSAINNYAQYLKGSAATTGVATMPIQTVIGGAINPFFEAGAQLLQGQKPNLNIAESIGRGFEFGSELGPIGKLAGGVFQPLLRKINPVEVGNINTYLDFAKKATTPELRTKFVNLAAKRIAQNIGAKAIEGGIGMGTLGAVQPANDLHERVSNLLSGVIQGALFGGVTQGVSYGVQGLRGVKPNIPLGLSTKPLTKEEHFQNLRKENIASAFDESKTPFKGLLGETVAQTQARRLAGLTPQEAYKGTDIQTFENEMNRLNTPLKEKVNVLDYFRTPENVMNKIGLGNEAKLLRTQWEKYIKEVPLEIQKIQAWASQVPPKSNQIIFKYLDGQLPEKALQPNELKVATEIKTYLSGWADKLGLPKESQISNYITHIFQNDIHGKEFPEEIANIIRQGNIAGSTYDPFLLKRYGFSGYKEDTWQALNAYVKRAVRKVNLDPALQEISRVSNNLTDENYKYVKRYIDNVQMRPSEVETLIDNVIKQSPIGYRLGQRPSNVVTQTGRQMIYRGLLGLNPSSALKNLTQGANTYAELGERYTLTGYAKVIQNLPKILIGQDTELNKMGVLNDAFIQDKQLPIFKNLLQKADSALFYMFETAEKINRGAAYWGAKARALNAGATEEEAIQKAKALVAKTQFLFSRIDTPVILQNDIAKTLGQFQSYTLKQFEFLGGKIANKEWAGLARYVGATFLMALTIGKAFGWKPQDIFPSLRFGVPPLLQTPIASYNAIAGTPDKYGNVPNLQKRISNIGNSLIPFIPAGGQIKKTVQGLTDVARGYTQTPSGGIKYPIEQNAGNYIKGALFGPYNLPEAQQYYDKGVKPLSEKQSQLFKQNIDRKNEIYQKIQTDRELNQQLDQAKTIVQHTGSGTYFNDKYLYLGDDGSVRVIDTGFQPTKPSITGLKAIDEERATGYRSDLTKREGVIKEMYNQNLLSADEANRQLAQLKIDSLNFDLERLNIVPLELTGNYLIDKKLRSDYRSQLTKRQNILMELYDAKQITLSQLESEVGMIDSLKASLAQAKKIGIRKVRLPAIPKLALKSTNPKPFMKIKALPKIKSIKISKSKNIAFKIKTPNYKPFKLPNIKTSIPQGYKLV